MGNGARDCLRFIVVIKGIIMGLLKIACLVKGRTLSNWHSGFTVVSLGFEITSALSELFECCNEDTSSRKQKHDRIVAAARTNSVGSPFKILATLNTYYNEFEEMKGMCIWCTIIEIVLVAIMFCCWCCIDEPKSKASTMKQRA